MNFLFAISHLPIKYHFSFTKIHISKWIIVNNLANDNWQVVNVYGGSG